MIINRIIKQNLGPDEYFLKLKIQSEDCLEGSESYRFYRTDLLRSVAENTGSLLLEGSPYEELKQFYDGLRWVVELSKKFTKE